jgi:hypothetical protein
MMTKERQARVGELNAAAHRRLNSEQFFRNLREHVTDFQPIPDAVHVWAVNRLRSPAPRFAIVRTATLKNEAKFRELTEKFVDEVLFESCCLFSYSIDSYPSAMMPVSSLIEALRKNINLVSRDGLVLSDLNFTSFLIADFEYRQSEIEFIEVEIFGLAATIIDLP